MDNLEKFIKNNREAFDDREPSNNIWDNISRQLPSGNQAAKWWRVAAIIFFCTTGVMAFQNYYYSPGLASGELSELETYYFTQIDYKKSLLNDMQHQNINVDNADAELEKLHAMYMVLKDEWKRKPSREVLEALTLNLLIRLDLLNRQLESVKTNDPPAERSI